MTLFFRHPNDTENCEVVSFLDPVLASDCDSEWDP